MLQGHPPQPEPPPIAPPGEPETCDQNPKNFTPNRIANIAYLARIVALSMVQVENAHIETTQAFAATQAGQPTPEGPDPSARFRHAVGCATSAMKLQNSFEQNTTIAERSEHDRARDAARAIRCHKEARRSEIRHKLDATLPNIRRSDAMSVRRDIEELLAGDEVEAMLETDTNAEIAMFICGDIGLKPDLSKWTDEELGYVHQPRPHQKSDTNWIPVANSRGMINYFAGPPLEPAPDTEPRGPPYGFD